MNKHNDTAKKIKEILVRELGAEVDVENQSHLHAGHVGARSGGGHFFVVVRSAKFVGLAPLARQRLVIAAVAPMMDKEIHALSMKCEIL